MIKSEQEFIELSFRGEGIIPENLSSSEVAEIISSYECAIMSLIARDNPEINLDDVFISLIGIEENSVHLKFKPKLDIILSAAFVINTAIISNHFETLPYRSVDSLNRIWTFTRNRNCSGEISGNNLPRAKISPDSEIKVTEDFFYKGETTIYGRVERVGGAVPRVRIKLDDDQVIYSDVSETMAKNLARQLYTEVCLKGLAKWRKEDLQIEDFLIEQVEEFKEISFTESISELRKLIGQKWDEIPDPQQFLTNLRYQSQ